MKHLNLIFSLALGTLLMSCDSDAFLSPPDNSTTRGIEYATETELSSSPKSEVSASEARKVAESLLASSTSIYKVQSTSRFATSVRPITDATGNTLMYIISYDNGGGYAIVSGTKKYTSVLAYSETGTFDETAGGQKDWLEAMKKTISQYASKIRARDIIYAYMHQR